MYDNIDSKDLDYKIIDLECNYKGNEIFRAIHPNPEYYPGNQQIGYVTSEALFGTIDEAKAWVDRTLRRFK